MLLLFTDNSEYQNCDGDCVYGSQGGQSWLCGENCQSLSTPCNGKCPTTLFELNCANVCELSIKLTLRRCGSDCITRETPCNDSCPPGLQLCNGKCQDYEFQCNGKCLGLQLDSPNCDGTCSRVFSEWMCNSKCQPATEPCNEECSAGCFLFQFILFIQHQDTQLKINYAMLIRPACLGGTTCRPEITKTAVNRGSVNCCT